MKRSKVNPAVDIVRIVSMLADKGDYSGIADGDDTPLGALVDAIMSIGAGMPEDAEERNAEIVAAFVALVRSVSPGVLAKMHAAARHQEKLHRKWDRDNAEAAMRPVEGAA